MDPVHDIDALAKICRDTARPGQCYMTVGVHPYHAAEPEAGGPAGASAEEYFATMASQMKTLLSQPESPLAAFGELGLDYDRTERASKAVQIRTFKAQLDLAVQEPFNTLPLFLHCRAACSDFIDIITPYLPSLPRKGLVHSFVGTIEEMQRLVALGFDLSVNGFSFTDAAGLEMVKAIPLDRLQLETDAPWGFVPPNGELAKKFPSPHVPPAPVKKRDKFQIGCLIKERNESCLIGQVAAIVAGVKGLPIEEVTEAAWKNSIRMFGLSDTGKHDDHNKS